MTTLSQLQSDCSQCAALCCMVAPFDKSDDFAFDKPAETPCPNLTLKGEHIFQCSIHSDLKSKGFGGCISYDCYGAGQHVTQTVFKGRNWKDDPALIPRMSAAFQIMETVHELILLLRTSQALPLNLTEARQLQDFLDVLFPDEGWTELDLLRFGSSDTTKSIRTFLKSLQHYAVAIQNLINNTPKA